MQPLQNFRDARRQRLPANAFFFHRRFGQIFHPEILPLLVIATEPIRTRSALDSSEGAFNALFAPDPQCRLPSQRHTVPIPEDS
jgi:hypothetical protein